MAVNYFRSQDAAESLCDELIERGVKAIPVYADVGNAEDVTRMVAMVGDELGPSDILMNNAGPYTAKLLLGLPVDEFDKVMSANVRATYLVTQAVGRLMKESGGGNVVNIGATSAYVYNGSVYGLAKAGVEHLTQALALELAPEVRVNTVTPGLIAENEGANQTNVRHTIEATPLGRLTSRTEIADMVCALCLPPFENVTGQSIVMDGGRFINRRGYFDLGHP